MQKFLTGCPLERISIDIMGPLPRSSKGNQYVLVVVDHFTKWTEAFPMPNQEASTVAKKLVSEFISKFGVPYEILTDQGSQFQSNLFTELARMLGIDKTRTTAYHPMANGLVERFNRTLEMMLSMYISETQRDWDQFIPLLMLAYRTTPQESTKVTPFRMMFGREANLPIDLILGRPPSHQGINLDSNEYVWELREKMETVFDIARKNLEKSAMHQKRLYDRKIGGKAFKEGDLVWLAVTGKKIGISPKLQRRWRGPFRVRTKLSEVLYQLHKPGHRSQIVHFNRLKPYEGYKTIRENEEEGDRANIMDMDGGDATLEETDHHEGAGHLEVLSSPGEEDKNECRSIHPVGDDQQETQTEELAIFRPGIIDQEVGLQRQARQRRPPQRWGYL